MLNLTERTATDNPSSDWFTVPEIAAQVRCDERSIYRAIKARHLRAARINNRGDLRICTAWLRDWLERRSV